MSAAERVRVQLNMPAERISCPPSWVWDDGGREAAGFKGKAGDCVTRSIAIATGLPYRHVYDELMARTAALPRRRSGSRRYSARTGVPIKVIRRYLEELGWSWTPTMFIGSGCQVHLRADELPGGVLIANCSKHLVAVVDGVVHDTHDPSRGGTRCVYGYWQPPVSRYREVQL